MYVNRLEFFSFFGDRKEKFGRSTSEASSKKIRKWLKNAFDDFQRFKFTTGNYETI